MRTWVHWIGTSAAVVAIVLAAIVFGLTGYGWGSVAKTTPSPTPSPTPVPLTQAETAYMAEMGDDSYTVGKAMDVATDVIERYGDWSEDDYELLAASLAVLVVADNKWVGREYPTERLARLHNLWLEALGCYADGARAFVSGYENVDLGRLERAASLFDDAGSRSTEARVEYARLVRESGL